MEREWEKGGRPYWRDGGGRPVARRLVTDQFVSIRQIPL